MNSRDPDTPRPLAERPRNLKAKPSRAVPTTVAHFLVFKVSQNKLHESFPNKGLEHTTINPSNNLLSRCKREGDRASEKMGGKWRSGEKEGGSLCPKDCVILDFSRPIFRQFTQKLAHPKNPKAKNKKCR